MSLVKTLNAYDTQAFGPADALLSEGGSRRRWTRPIESVTGRLSRTDHSLYSQTAQAPESEARREPTRSTDRLSDWYANLVSRKRRTGSFASANALFSGVLRGNRDSCRDRKLHMSAVGEPIHAGLSVATGTFQPRPRSAQIRNLRFEGLRERRKRRPWSLRQAAQRRVGKSNI